MNTDQVRHVRDRLFGESQKLATMAFSSKVSNEALLPLPNVAFGRAGREQKEGEVTEDGWRIAVRVFDADEAADKLLAEAYSITRGEIDVERVQGVPRAYFGQCPRHYSPVRPPLRTGACTSRESADSGTIGPFATDSKGWLAISNAHVVAGMGCSPSSSDLFHPCHGQGSSPSDRIGSAGSCVPLDPSTRANRPDAGLIRLDQAPETELDLPDGRYPLARSIQNPRWWIRVGKVGAASGPTSGFVSGLDMEVSFWYPDGKLYRFEGLFEITGVGGDFAERGDSGAMVFRIENGRAFPIGLVLGGTRARAYAHPIGHVLPELAREHGEPISLL